MKKIYKKLSILRICCGKSFQNMRNPRNTISGLSDGEVTMRVRGRDSPFSISSGPSSEDAPSEIRARLTYAIHRAKELLRSQLGKGEQLQTLLSLADLQIEIRDWPEARQSLALAASFCGESRLKRADIDNRLGLVCHWSEEHTEAVKHLRQALIVNPGDLTLRKNLGMALLRLKQFKAAQDEFARVLKSAPTHVDALLGAAEVCIELADDGDSGPISCSGAISHARPPAWQESGIGLETSPIGRRRQHLLSARIRADQVLQFDASGVVSMTLLSALADFRHCRRADPNHPKAPGAIRKITQRLRRRASGSFVDLFGPLVIFIAGTFVFLFAQLNFAFREASIRSLFWLPVKSSPSRMLMVYVVLTFGALLFMIAGLYLPKVLKLKIPGIELEKASVEQVSAPSSLDIGRSGSVTS